MTSPKLSRDEVQHIALLCRLGLRDEEVETLRNQLSDILANFQVLDQVDITGVPPTGHSVPLDSVMREDESHAPYDREEILANAPQRQGDFFRVKVVLD